MGSKESTNRNECDKEHLDSNYLFEPMICCLQSVQRNDLSPYPRSGHRIVCDEGNFFSYGGYNPQQLRPMATESGSESEVDEDDPQCLFREVWKFSLANKDWKKIPVRKMPTALASNSVILTGKILIVYGGTGVPFHIARSNKLYVCNLEEKGPTFKLIKSSGSVPPRLYGQAVFLQDEYLYTVGGTTGFEYYLDIYRINLQTNVWEEIYIQNGARNEPGGRYRHELAVVDKKVYVIGGSIGREAYDFLQIPVFDLNLRLWDCLISVRDPTHGYPHARQYHSVVRIPETNNFVMTGGLLGAEIYDDAWRLDIPSMQWTKLCSFQLATPVYFHASSITPSGKMYIFGGVTKNQTDNEERVADVQASWLCIPKLKEICWEAVVYYGVEKLREYTDSDIILPSQFSKRLIL